MIGLENGDVGPLPPLEWKFSQVFGERTAGEEVQEVDIISAIEFDKSGEHLATGDRGGRVVLFERTDKKDDVVTIKDAYSDMKTQTSRKDLEKIDYPVARHPEFRYKTEFQSHEPEFDYLKSLEIEEKINKVRWCHTGNGALSLLSTNDKTVKYWKVQEKKVKLISEMNVKQAASMANGGLSLQNGAVDFDFPPGGIPSLHLPVVVVLNPTPHFLLSNSQLLVGSETNLIPRCRRIYAHAHDYHINSISNNSDCETFISADDLRINLWNLEISNQSFNIVDVKPVNMEDLTDYPYKRGVLD
ncbi:Serine/threonine protein phosphatase 2A 55 kDa regulatory subunit B beta isoform [Asimina triloba]